VWIDICGITVAAGATVFLWRVSANMAALNADGLPGFPPTTGSRRC
jgi:hypothetical protein